MGRMASRFGRLAPRGRPAVPQHCVILGVPVLRGRRALCVCDVNFTSRWGRRRFGRGSSSPLARLLYSPPPKPLSGCAGVSGRLGRWAGRRFKELRGPHGGGRPLCVFFLVTTTNPFSLKPCSRSATVLPARLCLVGAWPVRKNAQTKKQL